MRHVVDDCPLYLLDGGLETLNAYNSEAREMVEIK